LSLRSKLKREIDWARSHVARTGITRHILYEARGQNFAALAYHDLNKVPYPYTHYGIIAKYDGQTDYHCLGQKNDKAIDAVIRDIELGIEVGPGLLGTAGAKKLLAGCGPC